MSTQPESWMIDDILQVPNVRYVILLSSDGLVRTYTDKLDKDTADQFSAGCAGLVSVVHSLGEVMGTGILKQVMTEYTDGFLFAREVGDGSRLAVVTGSSVDLGLVAQEMQRVILALGDRSLNTPSRT